jgi:hypothetical protein
MTSEKANFSWSELNEHLYEVVSGSPDSARNLFHLMVPSNGRTVKWAVMARSSARCWAYRPAIRVVVHPQRRARLVLFPPLRSQLLTSALGCVAQLVKAPP